MSKCCLRNSSGCCKSCRCAKLGERCANCNPFNHSLCLNWKARGGNQLKHSTTVTAESYKKNPRKALSVETIIDPTATPPETLKKAIKSGVDYQSPTLMDRQSISDPVKTNRYLKVRFSAVPTVTFLLHTSVSRLTFPTT